MRLGIIEYGAGNYESVVRAVQSLGVEPVPVAGAEDWSAEEGNLTHLIFPGVGSAAQAMAALETRRLKEPILAHARAGKPLLGICVGMQVLGNSSEETGAGAHGFVGGLGLLNFSVERLRVKAPVPHMGWNSVSFSGKQAAASFSSVTAVEKNPHFYFVHSYAASIEQTDSEVVWGTTDYDGVAFVSFVGRENVMGAQFHVEKSGLAGLALLSDFFRWGESC